MAHFSDLLIRKKQNKKKTKTLTHSHTFIQCSTFYILVPFLSHIHTLKIIQGSGHFSMWTVGAQPSHGWSTLISEPWGVNVSKSLQLLQPEKSMITVFWNNNNMVLFAILLWSKHGNPLRFRQVKKKLFCIRGCSESNKLKQWQRLSIWGTGPPRLKEQR